MEAINSKSINEAALRKANITLSQLESALGKADSPISACAVNARSRFPLGDCWSYLKPTYA